MRNVLALALECDRRRICPAPRDLHKDLIARSNVASQFHTLSHDESDFSNELLAARPIQRLCLDSMTYPVLGHLDVTLGSRQESRKPISSLFIRPFRVAPRGHLSRFRTGSPFEVHWDTHLF